MAVWRAFCYPPAMNVDQILDTMNRYEVEYLLIGGMNFLLRHEPVLTYDVDLWIDDTKKNRESCEKALRELHAEWGSSDDEWKPVTEFSQGWLKSQPVFCLTSPHGAIDIFRRLDGPKNWKDAANSAILEKTKSGIPYRGLSDEDMLKCQLALGAKDQKPDRIQKLSKAIAK